MQKSSHPVLKIVSEKIQIFNKITKFAENSEVFILSDWNLHKSIEKSENLSKFLSSEQNP